MLLAILESSSQAILAVDREGCILLANPRTEEMFGYSRGELAGARIGLLLPEESRSRHDLHTAGYFESPNVRPMGMGLDLAGRRKDGSVFPVEVSLSYVKAGGQLLAIAFVTDITPRKALEEQLMHAQKMEAIGRLAGGVAHDFNNMLTITSGYARMIVDALSPADKLRGYAGEILKASEKASELTRQLLAFSSRQAMTPRVIDVNELIADMEKMLRRLIGEDIELRVSLWPEGAHIEGDPSHITQAILNLAVNARDAMPEGGRLTVETAMARLDETYARTHLGVRPGDYVLIAVSDTGHGMDAETRRRIFEPFFTTKKDGKGTGLGLATVYGTVKQSGGEVWVYSEPGNGSTFKLYFPAVAGRGAAAGAAVPAAAAGGTETLLVAEDEDGVRELLAAMLTKSGYKVLAAANGQEALRLSAAHSGPIHLLVTDLVMPGMSGRQLATAIQAARPGTRVLFLSGYTANAAVQNGVVQGGEHFLAKPFTGEDIEGRIRRILDETEH
jgi:hypothetical protein